MQAVVVDNTSSDIDYLTGWYNQTTNTPDYNHTTAYSGNPNSEFQFTFNGTSISVYGCILPNNTAVSTYTLDGLAPVSYTNKNGTAYQSRQLFYQSPNVAAGEHTLVVTAPVSTIGLPWTTYCFDYLSYVPSDGSAEPGSGSAPPEDSQGAGASTGGGKSNNLKVILPAVLVPCLALLGLLAVVVFVQRRRLARLQASVEQSSTPYTQSSLLHRASVPTTLNTKASVATPSLAPSLLSPRPESSYSSDFVLYQHTTAEAGTAFPALRSPLAGSTTHGRSMSELGRELLLQSRGEAAPAPAESTMLDAPPTYTASR